MKKATGAPGHEPQRCGFCHERLAVKTVRRLLIEDAAERRGWAFAAGSHGEPHGFVEVEIPYCGRC